MAHQGHYPGQTLGAVGQPFRSQLPEEDRPPFVKAERASRNGPLTERALFAAYRHTRRRCSCHATEMSPLERRQRDLAAATIAAEQAEERTA